MLPGHGKAGPEVWSPRGVKVLGTPVGSDEFVKEVSDARLEEEHKLWNAIPWIPDLQCAWQCVGPLCHHFIRTMLRSKLMEHAQVHDRGMLRSMEAILGSLPSTPSQNETAHTLAALPMRMGGLGLQSAVRMAPAAFWASWADALPMIATRLPQTATSIVHRLTSEGGNRELSGRIAGGSDELGASRASRPDWVALRNGARPPVTAAPGKMATRWKKRRVGPNLSRAVDLHQRSVDNRTQTEQVSF